MPAKRIFLKGIDYFQLLIDHHSKKKGGRGHEARLAVFLQGKIEERKITDALLHNDLCRQLSTARISNTFGLGYPSLYFTDDESRIPVSFHFAEDNTIPDSFLNIPVDVYHKPPLHLQVIYFKNGNTCLLFTFHHILFDFAGVQSLMASLAGEKNVPLLPENTSNRKFSVRFRAFFRAVFFTFREANSHMTILERKLPSTKPLNSCYREIFFSKSETDQVYQNCLNAGVPLNHSIYFLAATCKGLHDKIFSQQKSHKFIWVPVPVNFRRKSSYDAVLFNGLSFLFYKLKPDQLGAMPTIIECIKSQMKEQVRNEMPDAFIDFADGYRFMPMPFYYPMLNLPSWGKLSSFSFSVLGNTFKNLNTLFGSPVTDIKNYPSNSTSPGATFLFYEYRGELKMMSSWVQGQYSDSEQDAVLQRIRELLIEAPASTSP